MAIRTNYAFDEIYNLIKDTINSFSSNKPTFWGEGSVARAIVKSIAYWIDFLQLQINITYSTFRTKTAKGIHLDNRMEDFNLPRNQATYAMAIQRFVASSGNTSTITVSAGTTVTTQQDIFGNTIPYTLQSTLLIPTGTTSVTGIVVCNNVGTIGNVASGAINLLPTSIVGVASTYNVEDVTNGTLQETDDDYRKRLINHLLGLKAGNEDSIISAIYAVEGISYVKILENYPSLGVFTIYVSTESGIVDSITRSLVNDAVKKVRGFCVTYNLVTPIVSGAVIEIDSLLDSDLYNQDSIISVMKQTLFDYVNNNKKNILYISDIVNILKAINGVINVKNIKINGIADDLALSNLYVLKILDLTDITINLL